MHKLYTDDIVTWAKEYKGERFHACLCDPPYHLTSIVKRFGKADISDDTYTSDKVRRGADGYSRLIRGGFMGQTWDGGYVAFRPETWATIGDCLLPGAYLLAFGGTRTWHRLAVAIEDAGFEIRDTVMWVYGSGFPKSHSVSKAVDKQAGVEREIIGMRKVPGMARTNVEQGAQNRTVYEFPQTSDIPSTDLAKTWDGYGSALKPAWEPIIIARKPLEGTIAQNCVEYGSGALNIDECRVPGESVPINKLEEWSGFGQKERPDYVQEINNKGRWPANLIHDGSEDVLGKFPVTKSGKMGEWNIRHTDGSPNGIYGKFDVNAPLHETIGDSGSAARFFYCAKTSPSERNAGLDKNSHPTLKPLALTEYLARLILPPAEYSPRRLLVPFSGAGSEMIGAFNAGWEEIVGIELSEEYTKIAEARLKYWTSIPRQMELK